MLLPVKEMKVLNIHSGKSVSGSEKYYLVYSRV